MARHTQLLASFQQLGTSGLDNAGLLTGIMTSPGFCPQVCGGSGMTPMLQVVREVLNNPDDKTQVSAAQCNVWCPQIYRAHGMCGRYQKAPKKAPKKPPPFHEGTAHQHACGCSQLGMQA